MQIAALHHPTRCNTPPESSAIRFVSVVTRTRSFFFGSQPDLMKQVIDLSTYWPHFSTSGSVRPVGRMTCSTTTRPTSSIRTDPASPKRKSIDWPGARIPRKSTDGCPEPKATEKPYLSKFSFFLIDRRDYMPRAGASCDFRSMKIRESCGR